MTFPLLWALFTVTAAAAQTLRNAMQRELTARLGTVGATLVRFVFGLPFACAFLIGVVLVLGRAPPTPSARAWAWIFAGAAFQIAATALMLAAMRERSFVVSIAYTKTEPVQAAVFALLFLGERPTPLLIAAILIATAGVILMSWPKAGAAAGGAGSWRPAALGITAGACFALSAVGFRGGVLALDAPSFVMAATTTLFCGLAIQSALLLAYLAAFDQRTAREIFRAWKPSLFAGFMGALASQFWFLAFALTSVARVRTLGLVEVIFAQIVSRGVFKQGAGGRDLAGMAMIAAGVLMLLWG